MQTQVKGHPRNSQLLTFANNLNRYRYVIGKFLLLFYFSVLFIEQVNGDWFFSDSFNICKNLYTYLNDLLFV